MTRAETRSPGRAPATCSRTGPGASAAPSSSTSAQSTVTSSPGRMGPDRRGQLGQRHVVAVGGAAVAAVELLVLAGDPQPAQPAHEDARAEVQVVLVARPGVDEDEPHPP